ncbi:MAG TPA: citrate/2-methylcitrate synthase [Clostridia bacterium]|nr:citrate/2-methylcitrate synthase [Clostridia bacterium]
MKMSKNNEIMKDYLEKLRILAETNNYIPIELHREHNTKRGLRNIDGTGVLVGLTRIGEVLGYYKDNDQKIPIEGRLLYRGMDINEIVNGFQEDKRFGFEETSYLLLFGELPNSNELKNFEDLLAMCRNLPDGFAEDMIFKAPSIDIMNKLARSVLASYSYDEDPDNISISNVLKQSIELIARFPSMIACAYQAKCHYHNGESLHIHYPQKHLSIAENILYLIRPDNNYTPLEAEILDLSLVLHAEHGGGNNSSFATHVVTSSGTDTYSTIAAAIGSLKGPKHGGANSKVMAMVENIKSNVADWSNEKEVEDYLRKILRKEAFDGSGLIYGIGHAVYTLSDPRAILLKQKAAELAEATGMKKEFDLYTSIEKLSPEVFQQEKNDNKIISANVDFYSGFVYKTLNLPEDLYTPIFAMARMPGWAAHRIEELISGGRIIRPAYKSVLSSLDYMSLDER